MPPDLALWLTPTSSNCPCFEHISMVSKVYEPLKFYCMSYWDLKTTVDREAEATAQCEPTLLVNPTVFIFATLSINKIYENYITFLVYTTDKRNILFQLIIILFYSISCLRRSPGHHRWIRNNPFPFCPVFSCPSWADKVHFCPLFDIVFPSLLLFASFSVFLIPSTVPCRTVFAKPEDLETWRIIIIIEK